MRDNLTKRALREGRPVFGVFMRYLDPALVELVAHQGWDFIVFDGESTWLEGLALIALYVIIAASVWFGPPIQAP